MKMSGEKKVERWKSRVPVKVPLTAINEHLMCELCVGYLIDATVIIECRHTFCKSCIIQFFKDQSEKENVTIYCPKCDLVLDQARPLLNLRSDETLQKLVYKLVPGLVGAEIARRKEFRENLTEGSSGETSGESSGGGDSVVETLKGAEEFCFLAPDDTITLSLEYFKSSEGSEVGERSESVVKAEETPVVVPPKSKPEVQTKKLSSPTPPPTSTEIDKANDRRYLMLPAAVSVGILKKFIRQKYGLSDDYRVDLLYNGDSENNLENELTLLDLSFIYKWKKAEPMCFHYRIFDRPSKSVASRLGVKRGAPSVLDEPPPDDAPPGPGGTHQNHSTTTTATTPSTKHARLGGGATTGGERTTTSSSEAKDSSKGQTTAVTPLTTVKGQAGKSASGTGRGRSTSVGDETEGSTTSSSSPGYSPRGSGYESLSPVGKNSSGDQVMTSCSSPESPSSPLKISIKADGTPKHHHRHRHHRHHKEKHKRRKSKSKSKSKDREKSKEKERYKYNAHPNPSQSQTISVKPGKHHHHHHHHKNRDKETAAGLGNGPNVAITTSTVAVTATTVGNGGVKSSQPQQQRPRTTVVGGLLEPRRPGASSGGIEVKPIVPPGKPSSAGAYPGPMPTNPKLAIGKPQNMKISESLQLQVPKSVTLIPVTPGGKSRGSSGTGTVPLARPNNSQTFTHPITNKSLHQITVTEVPPPNSKMPATNASSVSNNSSANAITIEKCSPNPSSHSSKPLFNGPGSMEITKIYCDTTTVNNPSSASSVPKPKVTSTTSSAGGSSVFESHSQGKKLKGLDISITPSPPTQVKGQHRKGEEPNNNSFGKMTSSLAGIPKIPGVSILPQAVHNAHREQQRKFNSTGVMMSFSCTKINESSSNNGKVSSSHRLLSTVAQQQLQKDLRSSSPADKAGGSGRTPPRKSSADSNVYDSGRGTSPPHPNQGSRKLSLPQPSGYTHAGYSTAEKSKSRDPSNLQPKGIKRPLESSSPVSGNKKPRGDQPEKKRQETESLPLDLSGRSSRLTPPGSAAGGGGSRPLTPIPLHVPTNATHQSQSSPKSSSQKTQSTPSIDSIVENLTQKHQRGHQRSSTTSTSSKESMSPPASSSVPLPHPVTSPPIMQTYHHHPDLLTLSNAAAAARKMSHHQKQQQQQAGTTAMSNLLAAANAMAYACPQGSMGPPPNSAGGAGSLILPGLLQQFNHHQLSAMMLSPPGVPGAGGMKSPMATVQGGLYSGYPGMNGRMPSSFGSVAPAASALSPPFYANRPNPASVPASPSVPTLKIPSLGSSRSKSRSPTSTPLPPTVATKESSSKGGSKSPKTNGTIHPPQQPAMVASPPQKPKVTPSAPSSGGASFSFGISNFLKDTHGKGGVDPNAKAIVTSSSVGLEGSQGDFRKERSSKSPSSYTDTKVAKTSPPREQSLPMSKLLGLGSPPSKISSGGAAEESKTRNSRLGDLGLALGLIPCDPPMISLTESTATKPTATTAAATVPKSLLSPKNFGMGSLLPPPPTTQHQNQAVRQIPNPSLLSSRQNCCNNNNSGVTSTTIANNAETRIWKSNNGNGTVTNNKGDLSLTHPTLNPALVPVTMKPTNQPQSIELNMKLWIDRYESLRAQGGMRAEGHDDDMSADSKDPTTPVVVAVTGDEDVKTVKEEPGDIPQITFSASVPTPSLEFRTEHSDKSRSTLPGLKTKDAGNPVVIVKQEEVEFQPCHQPEVSKASVPDVVDADFPLLESAEPILLVAKADESIPVPDFCPEEDDDDNGGMEISETEECKVSSDAEKSHAVAMDEVEKEGQCEMNGDIYPTDAEIEPEEEEVRREREPSSAASASAAEEEEPVEMESVDDAPSAPIVIETNGDDEEANDELMNEFDPAADPSSAPEHVEMLEAGTGASDVSLEKVLGYIVPLVAAGDDNDSPALVIDEDEEEEDVRTRKQEGEGDSSAETQPETHLPIQIDINDEEAGGNEDPGGDDAGAPASEAPAQEDRGNGDEEGRLEGDAARVQSPSEGTGTQDPPTLEGPGAEGAEAEDPRVLLDGSPSLIGSELPPLSAAAAAVEGVEGTSPTRTGNDEVESVGKGLDLGKVAAGLFVSAASINNNNNISPERDAEGDTRVGECGGAGETRIPVVGLPINPPPVNPTPPPPTVTNV